MPDDLAADLEAHLSDAAVNAGDVPADVAQYATEGCPTERVFLVRQAMQDEDSPTSVDSLPVRAAAWQISGDGAAAWAMAKAAEAAGTLDRIGDLYRQKRAALDDWRDTASGPHTRTKAYMAERLASYALARRAADPRAKTLPLPDGVVRTTAPRQPWKVEVVDEDALLAWAVADGRDDMIRPTLRPKTDWLGSVNVVDKDGELRVLDGAGEVVPGVAVERTETTATVHPTVRP